MQTKTMIALLDRIASKTKCDCWFFIRTYKTGKRIGQPYVRDLENGVNLSLKNAVPQLMEALDCRENLDACGLSVQQKLNLVTVLKSLGIAKDVRCATVIKLCKEDINAVYGDKTLYS